MLTETRTAEDLLVSEFVARVNGAGDEAARRAAYREAFDSLRSHLSLYPVAAGKASAVFESAAKTARLVAANCLPLGIAVAMHLYPLCALQCVPLPLLSTARIQRAMLVRTIRNRSLILANAGSERTRVTCQTVVATEVADGIRVDGTYDYMSLASIADFVLFKAPLANSDRTVLCAADLRSDAVRIGSSRFRGSMRLSDTSSVTFVDQRIPRSRCLLVPEDERLRCASDYQRCWFQLFLAEIYLARLERLERTWGLARSVERIVSLNEVSLLREYSLRLLDDFPARGDIEPLSKATTALKLRVSMLAQSTLRALRDLETSVAADARQLRADANELGYIRSQPAADEKILLGLGAA